jgi:hypothetical protein
VPLSQAKAEKMAGVVMPAVALPPPGNGPLPTWHPTNIEALMQQPARKQASYKSLPRFELNGTEYNIWYGKYLGDPKFERYKPRKLSEYRCVPNRDSGYTRGSRNEKEAFLCLYFARGRCVLGDECPHIHRLPTEKDEVKLDLAHDIFGRERHATDREDMGGTGNFNRDNRTLYLGGLKNLRKPGQTLEEIVKKHFMEWGEIEYVRVIYEKSIAFVKFKLRGAAEFAKEAMADQTMDYGEVLNVRWANEDPNPIAQAQKEQRTVAKAIDAAAKKYWDAGGEAYYNYVTNYDYEYALTAGNDQYYPVTDYQYQQHPALPAPSDPNAAAAGYDPNYYNYYNQQYYGEEYEKWAQQEAAEQQKRAQARTGLVEYASDSDDDEEDGEEESASNKRKTSDEQKDGHQEADDSHTVKKKKSDE